jgi:hypothetical protein
MTSSTRLRLASLLSIALLYANVAQGEMCTCPKNPIGTECNNNCKDNPDGVVWISHEPKISFGPGVPAALPPPPRDKDDGLRNERESSSQHLQRQ